MQHKTISAQNTRRAAALMLAGLMQNKPMDAARDRLAHLSPQNKVLAEAMVMLAMRHHGEIKALLRRHLKRPLPAKSHLAVMLLHIGLVQIFYMDIPAYAAVSETVNACRQGEAPWRGLINALLRKLSALSPQAAGLPDNPVLNMPEWMMRQWQADYGTQKARAIAHRCCQQPPLDLCFKSADLATQWMAENNQLMPSRLTPTHIRLTTSGLIKGLPGFADGIWWVQDVAAGFPAALLVAAGLPQQAHILDLCAAPGGKSLQLAAHGYEITALDIAAKRLALVQENLLRTHLSARLIEADGCHWQADALFDGVLVDAPCSASGIIRRHPDLLLPRKPPAMPALTALQDKLLANAAKCVRPGGFIVYAVCSLDSREGEQRIRHFLACYKDFALHPVSVPHIPADILHKGQLRCTPADWADKGGMDGFFAALLQKTA